MREGYEESFSEPTLSDYWRLIWSKRYWVLSIGCAAAVLSGLISFLLPPTFEATTTLMPVIRQTAGTTLGGLGLNLEDLGVQPVSAYGSLQVYPEIMRSRRVVEALLSQKFVTERGGAPRALVDIIETSNSGRRRLDVAIKALRKELSANVDRKTGILTLRVRSHYPQLAADIANSLASLMLQVIIEMSASNAGANRRFIEGRLAQTRAELASAEERLNSFRERNIRIGNAPHLAMEESRLARAVREQEEVYLTLQRQYELAKIEEQRDTPTLAVLDPATPPVFKSAPKKRNIIGFSVFITVLLSSCVIVIRGSQHSSVLLDTSLASRSG